MEPCPWCGSTDIGHYALGRLHYGDGDVWDDIYEEIICNACGEVIYTDKPEETDEIPY
jgi:hypothetical protein